MDLLLLFQTLVLNLQKEITLAENVLILLRRASAPSRSARPSSSSHSSPLRQPENPISPFGMFRQVSLAHPRLAIKAMQRSLRRDPNQVPVALLVLRQHQQVIVLVPSPGARWSSFLQI